MTDSEEVGKPFAGFENFDACVSEFETDPSVDDPQALCGWLEENRKVVSDFDPDSDESLAEFVRSLDDPQTDTVLTELEVSFVSGVETPAQDSQWVFAKDASDDHQWGVNAPIVVKEGVYDVADEDDDEDDDDDDEEQKAWAPVLIPNEVDKQGDVIPPAEIEKAAHKYLKEHRQVDTDHDLLDGKGEPIESWTLKEDQDFELPNGSETRTYAAGTWMMGVEFDDEPWKRIKEGELTGFSIYGEAAPVDVEQVLGEEMKGSEGPDPAEDTDGIKRTVLQSIGKQDGFEDPCWDGYTMVGTQVDENGNEVPNCVPDDDVPDAQSQSADKDSEMAEEDTEETETSKQLEGDVAEAMAAFFDEHGGTVSTMTIADFVEWATGEDLDDLPDVVEVEGVEIPIRPEEEPEADEEDMEEDGMDDDMEDTQMSDNEEESKDEAGEATDGEAQAQESQPEWAAEMHDSIKSVGNTVDDVKTRVADLEKEVFEEAGEAAEDASDEIDVDEAAEKALAKMAEEISGDDLDEDDDPADIVRKNLHEVDDSPSGGAVDEWSADEIEAGYGGGE